MKTQDEEKRMDGRLQFTFSTLTATGEFPTAESPIKRIGEICAVSGCVGIEGCVPLVFHRPADERTQIANSLAAESKTIHSFHLPFKDQIGNDVASLYETERVAAVACMRTWIDIAVSMGSQIGILHPTTRKGFDVGVDSFDSLWNALHRSLQDLAPYCSERGFRIAVENLPGHGVERFGSRPEHFARMRRELPGDSIGFCLDTGHAMISEPADPTAFFDAMGDRLIAFHLADNAGDRDSHLAPGRGRFPWSQLAAKLKDSAFEGPLCIETPPFGPGPPYSNEDWAAMVEQTKNLLS